MHDGEKTLATLQWLADAGFGLAVDDFRTGY
jgi:EAL domain-containing protein (putative c-di-GMP-specific phosphodiesterase class I)